jgi:4-amino-4-deoxy-L-arabinose transferase-like glycosyltransferase
MKYKTLIYYNEKQSMLFIYYYILLYVYCIWKLFYTFAVWFLATKHIIIEFLPQVWDKEFLCIYNSNLVLRRGFLIFKLDRNENRYYY